MRVSCDGEVVSGQWSVVSSEVACGLWLVVRRLVSTKKEAIWSAARLTLQSQFVERIQHALSAPVQNVCIDHRRRHIRIAQQLLHRPDIVT